MDYFSLVCQYCVTLFLVIIALILNVIVLRLSRNHTKHGPTSGVCKALIDSWYGSLLGLKKARKVHKTQDHEMKDGHVDENQTSMDENCCNYMVVGALIDRTAFLIYLIIFVLMTMKQVV